MFCSKLKVCFDFVVGEITIKSPYETCQRHQPGERGSTRAGERDEEQTMEYGQSPKILDFRGFEEFPCPYGKRDSIHHHLLEKESETANVLELRQKLLHTTTSGWW